jgi:bifunctional DNase/RNase
MVSCVVQAEDGSSALRRFSAARPPEWRVVGQFVVQPSRLQVQAGRLHHKLGKLTHYRMAVLHTQIELLQWRESRGRALISSLIMIEVPLAPGGVVDHPESEAPVPVQMELRRIIISEIHEQQVIVLREVEGDRSFPIVIGVFEATSIERRVKGMPSPRPLTHDLLANVIDQLGGELQDVFVSELRDHTYYAKLRVRRDGELIEVDSRPSDAIALAVTAKVPIYVSEEVLDEVIGQ